MHHFKINTQELIEVINNETNEKQFLLLKNGNWISITQEQYNNIIEGEKNGL